MKNLLVLTAVALIMGCKQQTTTNQVKADKETRFTATDSSLVKYQTPEWYKDAKLGYWVHWGIYSIPAYAGDHAAEWYGRWMYAVDDGSGKNRGPGFEKRGLKTAEYHRTHFGNPKEFGYKDFVPMFTAEKFDANVWADLFVEGGAKFFTMMAMHHDNFCLWDSESTPFNSVNMGPKRDFVAEMKEAISKRGLRFGVSNHSAWNGDFFAFNHYNGFDGLQKEYQPLYGTGSVDSLAKVKWWERTTELAEKYKPDLYYFDWGWHVGSFTKQDREDFVAFYYNKAIDWNFGGFPSPNVVVNYKGRENLPYGSAVLDLERGGMKDIEKRLWQNDTSLGLKSWSYDPNEVYRGPNQVVDMLMDIISKNGVLMLNIGPNADGSIPEKAKTSIKQIGKWLKKNGEAVYATRPWEVYGEGATVPEESMEGDVVEYIANDIRFTRNKDNTILYATFLSWPGEEAVITILNNKNIDLSKLDKVALLETSQEIPFKQDKDGFYITFPDNTKTTEYAYVIKLEFKEKIPSVKFVK